MITLVVGVAAATVIITGALRLLKYLNSRKERGVHCQCQNRVRGKVIIVTGANSGIGYETSAILAKRGAVLYLACRNGEAGTAAVEKIRRLSQNRHVYYLHLDLNNFHSVKQFVLEFFNYEKRVDAVVHNAGVFHHPQVLSEDGFDVTFQTNYLGPVLLTELLKPALRSVSSRVVFLSSLSHRWVTPEDVFSFDPRSRKELESFMSYVTHYAISKLALKFYALHCTQVFVDCDVSVTSVDPGTVWTPIYRNCWREWWQIYRRVKCSLLMRTTYDGAQSVIHALCVPNIKSGYIKDCEEVEWNDEHVGTSGEMDSFITRSLVWTKLR